MSDTEDSSPIGIPSKLTATISSLNDTLAPVLKKPWSETADKLEALERAKMDVMMAYTLVDLVWVYLKTRGIDPATHPVTDELERVKSYYAKIRAIEFPEKEKPRAKLDIPAAQRFINHAIPASQRSQHLKLDNRPSSSSSSTPATSAAQAAAAGAARAVTEQDAELELAYSKRRYKAERFKFVAGEAERVIPGQAEDGRDGDGGEDDTGSEVEEEEEEEKGSSMGQDMDVDEQGEGDLKDGGEDGEDAEAFLAGLQQEWEAGATNESERAALAGTSASGSDASPIKSATLSASSSSSGKRKRPSAVL